MNETWLAAVKNWYAAYPRPTRIVILLALGAIVILVIGWAKYFYSVEPGTIINHGKSAIVISLSFLVASLIASVGLLTGVIQAMFFPPRKAGLVSIGFGLLPGGFLALILWYVQNVRHIVFE